MSQAGPAELHDLAEEVRTRFAAVQQSDRDRFRRYRELGDTLIRAKERLAAKHGSSHGRWGDWLGEHCSGLSERTAQKYMRFAKSAPGADLETEERAWRRVSDKPKVKAKAKADPTAADTAPATDMDGHVVASLDDRDEADRLRNVLADLKAWVPGVKEHGVLIASVYHLHDTCGMEVARG